MIHYVGFAELVVTDQNCHKAIANAYGNNNQIICYGGSQNRDIIVHTPMTKFYDYYPHRERTPPSTEPEVHEWTNKTKHENKQTGSYERVTVKEKTTKGETCVEKSTGRYGIADEYKWSSSVKIGDKSGYTEYYTEVRFRRVNYDWKNYYGNKKSTNNSGGKPMA